MVLDPSAIWTTILSLFPFSPSSRRRWLSWLNLRLDHLLIRTWLSHSRHDLQREILSQASHVTLGTLLNLSVCVSFLVSKTEGGIVPISYGLVKLDNITHLMPCQCSRRHSKCSMNDRYYYFQLRCSLFKKGIREKVVFNYLFKWMDRIQVS